MNDFAEIISEELAEQSIARKLATIGAVYSDGVSLIFDGESTATEKHYKANTAIIFAAGDRVKIAEVSGTYVVEYIVGAPGADYPASPSPLPVGGTTGQVLAKSGDGDYAIQWKTVGVIPAGGTTGQALVKSTDADNDVAWGDILASKIGTTDVYAYMSSYWFVPPYSSSTSPYGLGSSSKPWYHLYTGGGNTLICTSGGSLGFFGKTPVAKQTLSSSATASQIVTALKAYGLYT